MFRPEKKITKAFPLLGARSGLTILGAFAVLISLLAGCGGSGGGTPVATPTPTPTPVAPPTPVPPAAGSALDRTMRSNFSPNYIPSDASRYLRWADNKKLRVFIHAGVNNIKDNVPAPTLPDDAVRALVRQSLDLWTAQTGGDFLFTLVDDVANSDIEIYFVTDVRRLNGTTSSGLGVTNYSFFYPDVTDTAHAVLKKSVIQVRADQSADGLLDVTAHEFGHALGIEKHSLDDNDLMFATSIPPAAITQRDQNTLFYLYYSPTALGGASKAARGRHGVYISELICGDRTRGH